MKYSGTRGALWKGRAYDPYPRGRLFFPHPCRLFPPIDDRCQEAREKGPGSAGRLRQRCVGGGRAADRARLPPLDGGLPPTGYSRPRPAPHGPELRIASPDFFPKKRRPPDKTLEGDDRSRAAFLDLGGNAWYFGFRALAGDMKSKALVVFILASLAVWPGGELFAQEKVQDQAAHEYVVRAITLAITVQDSKGRFVNNLTQKDFSIFENSKKKPITYFLHDFGAPLSLTVLLDVSGSMALEGKLDECKAALRNLATGLLRPRDEIALLLFADGQVEVAAKHATDKSEFLKALDKAEAYGQTALNDAVGVSPEFATRAKNEKRALLLITDGIENDSQSTPEQALEIARRVDVPIYTIGYKIPRNEQLASHKRSTGLTSAGIIETLTKFSQATGGKAWFLNEPTGLASVVQEIKNEQAHQYIIGYTSYQDTSDLYRWIRVTTPNYKHKVRTRQGY